MQAPDGVVAAPAQQSLDAGASQTASDSGLQRILKLVVVGLAILLFAGLAAVVGRVIYLASSSAPQPAAPTLAIRPEQSLELPPGAQVRSVSLSGNRLAVHYDVGTAAGIAVLDLQTGHMVTNVAVEPKPAGN
jgi:Family of unknown function (DUF6476)